MVYFWIGFGICIVPVTICLIALVIMSIDVLEFHFFSNMKKLGIKIEELTENDIPNYRPAVMGYLVNMQKIGSREVLSTLFDLISRGVIKVDIKKGLVSDNDASYELTLLKFDDYMSAYEYILIDYLFKTKSDKKMIKITDKFLQKKLYKDNLDKGFLTSFCREVQKLAKTYDFYSPKLVKRKKLMYFLAEKVTSTFAIISSILIGIPVIIALILLFTAEIGIWEAAIRFLDYLPGKTQYNVLFSCFVFPLIVGGIVWVSHFLVSFFYNVTCKYNEYSENGKKDYVKWMGFKKYLMEVTSLPNHPIMGVTIWQKYFAYSIGLKCSKKFFEQLKAMNIVDKSIDVSMVEFANNLVDCIQESAAASVRTISVGKYGGCHIDY